MTIDPVYTTGRLDGQSLFWLAQSAYTYDNMTVIVHNTQQKGDGYFNVGSSQLQALKHNVTIWF